MNKREETILILFVWKISVFFLSVNRSNRGCWWISRSVNRHRRSATINVGTSNQYQYILELTTTTFLVLNLSVAKDEIQITLLTRIYTMWIDQMYAVFFRNSVCAAVTAICKSNAINIDNESRPQAAHSDSFITFVVCLIVLFTLFVHFFFYWSKKWVRKSWILWVMINHCWWQTQQCKTRNNGMSVHPETE